jgi:hypothetical protein
VVTLQKRFGKTGKVKSENGALYIGNFDENGVKTGLGSYYHYNTTDSLWFE